MLPNQQPKLIGLEYKVTISKTIPMECDEEGRRFLLGDIDLNTYPKGWTKDQIKDHARSILNDFDPPVGDEWFVGDEQPILTIPEAQPSTQQSIKMRVTLVLSWRQVGARPLIKQRAEILFRDLRSTLEPALDEAGFAHGEGTEKLVYDEPETE